MTRLYDPVKRPAPPEGHGSSEYLRNHKEAMTKPTPKAVEEIARAIAETNTNPPSWQAYQPAAMHILSTGVIKEMVALLEDVDIITSGMSWESPTQILGERARAVLEKMGVK